jgi:hypothetical protein
MSNINYQCAILLTFANCVESFFRRSYAVQPVRLYPILMSILLHHFKELIECIKDVERIEARLNGKNKGSTKEKEKEEEQLAQPTAVPQQRQGQLKLSEF